MTDSPLSAPKSKAGTWCTPITSQGCGSVTQRGLCALLLLLHHCLAQPHRDSSTAIWRGGGVQPFWGGFAMILGSWPLSEGVCGGFTTFWGCPPTCGAFCNLIGCIATLQGSLQPCRMLCNLVGCLQPFRVFATILTVYKNFTAF